MIDKTLKTGDKFRFTSKYGSSYEGIVKQVVEIKDIRTQKPCNYVLVSTKNIAYSEKDGDTIMKVL